MLYLRTKSGYDYSWHVGEPLRSFDPGHIATLQADCDELEFIRGVYPGAIPKNASRVVIWVGCIAATIYENIRLASLRWDRPEIKKDPPKLLERIIGDVKSYVDEFDFQITREDLTRILNNLQQLKRERS